MSRTAAVPTQRKASKNTLKSEKVAPSNLPAKSSQGRLRAALTIAEERGLLSGSRTHVLRGRARVADDYAQWLLSQRGTVNPELDLEF